VNSVVNENVRTVVISDTTDREAEQPSLLCSDDSARSHYHPGPSELGHLRGRRAWPDIFPRLLRKAREMSVTFGWPHFISDQTSMVTHLLRIGKVPGSFLDPKDRQS
jgi:hypothetical protein